MSVVLAFSALLIGASAAPAADQIAYHCASDICLIDPDAPDAGITNLTKTNEATEKIPAWSPDGNKIAFRGEYPGVANDIFTLEVANPAEATNVSDTNLWSEDFPVWSPDGSRIAYHANYYTSASPAYGFDILVSPASGTADPVQIGSTTGGEHYPSWTPDGARVAFVRDNQSIWTGAADGSGTATPLASAVGSYPALSPDGKYVAGLYITGYPYKVHITRTDGSGVKEPTVGDLSTTFGWSPDSTRVAFVHDGNSGPDEVWVAPADGSNAGHAVPMPSGWVVPHNATFSPDGTRIAFDARQVGGNEYEQLLVAPADGSAEATPITSPSTNSESPDWKPCEGCAPPVTPPPGSEPAPTKKAKKFAFASYKRVVIFNTFVRIAYVECKGVNSGSSKIAQEACKFHGDVYTKSTASAAPRPWSGSSDIWAKPKAKKVLFAKGDITVPVGKTKLLPLKITRAGKKLVKPGKTLKLTLTITKTQKGQAKQKVTKTVKLKVPKKK